MSQRTCAVAGCGEPRHIGKNYCLDHYKQTGGDYGLDAEIQAKLQAKIDPQRMAQAQAFIEALSGEKFKGTFHESLKSGVLLCKAVNAVKPGLVKNINMGNAPFVQRENIVAYLNACGQLGMKEVDKFVTQDLFEGDNLVVVVDNIFSLGSLAQKVPGYRGPVIGVKQADSNVREFAPEVVAAGKAFGTRITMGDHGYQDETKNPSLGRQIIQNVSGHDASSTPTKMSMGSYGIQPENLGSGIDKIIRNPDQFAAQRGQSASVTASAASGAAGAGFCGNCGTPKPSAAAKFCGSCGNKL